MKHAHKEFQISHGFTLIELLVVISIVGILTSLLLVNLSNVRARGRDATRKADLKKIQAAIELYRADDPDAKYVYQTVFPPPCGAPFTNAAGTITYLDKMPCDPKGGNYMYDSTGIKTGYCMRACLENVNDAQSDVNTGWVNPPSPYECGVTVPNCPSGSASNYTINWFRTNAL